MEVSWTWKQGRSMFKRIEPGKSPCCRSKSAPHQTNMTLFALTFSSMPLDKPAIAWLASSTLYHDKHDQHDNIIILYRPQYPLKCPLPREQRHAYGYTSWSMETAEDNFNPSYRFFLSIGSITFQQNRLPKKVKFFILNDFLVT